VVWNFREPSVPLPKRSTSPSRDVARPGGETPATSAPSPATSRGRAQFTIFSLFVLTFVASIGFSQLYYAARAARGDRTAAPIAILMSVALPMLVMIALSAVYQLRSWLNRRR
jgi:amino acid transporter